MKLNEIWKPVVGYEGRYEVSNLGRVRGLISRRWGSKLKTPKLMSQHSLKEGYMRIGLTKDGIKKKPLVHRLVAEAFLGIPSNKMEVNHKDSDKSNNSLSNLEWTTASNNVKHCWNSGNRKPKARPKMDAYDKMCKDMGISLSTIYRMKNKSNETN